MKIPKKYSGVLFAFLMSFLMALLMSSVLTAVFAGIDHQFITNWMNGFIRAWPIAFPAVLIIAPIVRKMVAALTY
jgi:membrane protease YdiL (CAAX protease family)